MVLRQEYQVYDHQVLHLTDGVTYVEESKIDDAPLLVFIENDSDNLFDAWFQSIGKYFHVIRYTKYDTDNSEGQSLQVKQLTELYVELDLEEKMILFGSTEDVHFLASYAEENPDLVDAIFLLFPEGVTRIPTAFHVNQTPYVNLAMPRYKAFQLIEGQDIQAFHLYPNMAHIELDNFNDDSHGTFYSTAFTYHEVDWETNTQTGIPVFMLWDDQQVQCPLHEIDALTGCARVGSMPAHTINESVNEIDPVAFIGDMLRYLQSV